MKKNSDSDYKAEDEGIVTLNRLRNLTEAY